MAFVCLYHGTDLVSANEILVNGLDAVKAASYNGGGEFWATTDQSVADWFARTNPAAGPPARIEFAIDDGALKQICGLDPEVVVTHGSQDFEFLPASFPMLQQAMSNVAVQEIV